MSPIPFTEAESSSPYLTRLYHDLHCLHSQQAYWASVMQTEQQNLTAISQDRYNAQLRHDSEKVLHAFRGQAYMLRMEADFAPYKEGFDHAVRQAKARLKSNTAQYYQAERRGREKQAEIDVERNRLRRESRMLR